MKVLTEEQVNKIAEPSNDSINFIYELLETEKLVGRSPKDTKDIIKIVISDQRLNAVITYQQEVKE